MLGLRTTEGISQQEYERRYRGDFAPLAAELRLFAQYGWAVETQGRWHFTPEGFLRSNELIGRLLEARSPQRG
jgi:oxygen-independent coproporphyrinogen-3 oxidase